METTKPIKVDTPFWNSFDPDRGWPVPDEWQKELYNYVVLGYAPGSFHSALCAGDLMSAAIRSHSDNTWPAIVAFCKWLINVAPRQCWGNYKNVEAWLDLTKEERKNILLEKGLLYSEKEVTWNILSRSE